MKETPAYIKVNSMISGILLAPFFIALLANSIDKVVGHETLYGSWLWKSPTLAIWVLRLPELALILAFVTYIVYVVRGKGSSRSSWLKRAIDIRHSWPVLVPTVLAFGILFLLAFHDSAQCWGHSVGYTITHTSQVWRCTRVNQSLAVFQKIF